MWARLLVHDSDNATITAVITIGPCANATALEAATYVGRHRMRGVRHSDDTTATSRATTTTIPDRRCSAVTANTLY